jgi:Myc proto-oncogene protein
MPSDDIWKKFELLPTPPLSPSRDTATGTPSDLDLGLDLEEHLPFDVAELLNDDKLVAKVLPSFPEPPPIPISTNLHSKLIQDCMWSGLTGILADITKSDKNSGFDLKSSDCVDPAAVFPYPIADTHCHNLGTETPSDSGVYILNMSCSYILK